MWTDREVVLVPITNICILGIVTADMMDLRTLINREKKIHTFFRN